MSHQEAIPPLALNDCWNRIGIQGNRSCEKLVDFTHCRNCAVYGEAARTIMQRPLPAHYQRDWATQFAVLPSLPVTQDQSALVFRIGCEWLGLPTRLCLTVAEMATAHRLPHRDSKTLVGIVSVKGKLYPCMSLAGLMAVGAEEADRPLDRQVYPRLLVMQLGQHAYALPVQDLHGVHRYGASDVLPLPATANQTVHRYLTGVVDMDGLKVGCLDAELIGYQLASALQ